MKRLKLPLRATPAIAFLVPLVSGPSPDPPTMRLVEALRNGDRPTVRRIVAGQPQLANLKGPGGTTPLMYAAFYGDRTAVRLLLDAGADPDGRNDAGATALMWAVSDAETTRLLLDYGADANARSELGQTALSIAAGRFGSASVIKLLLEYGADPSASQPGAALQGAASAGDSEVFQLLAEHGADLKSAGARGLMLAIRAHCARCAELLIATVSRPDLDSALGALAPFGDARALATLLDHGADVNARLSNVRRDMDGRTPLMLAASSDLTAVDAVKMLIDRGADINATGPGGESALDLAKRNGLTAVVGLLTASGAHESTLLRRGGTTPDPHLAPQPATSVRAALERSIPLLQRSDGIFIQKAGCVSCHHNTFTAMTIAMARAHGVPIDEQVAREQARRIASVLEGRRERALQGIEITNTASNILVGLAAEHHAPDFTTDAMAHFLKTRQLPDGSWRNAFVDHRPPIQASDIEATATSIRALQVYAPKPLGLDYERAVVHGTSWLMKIQPRTTDERALQLLGLKWGGVKASHEFIRKSARNLAAEQRADGGWAQLPTLASDAYATGQALVALGETGGLEVSDDAYQRGVRFLLNSQLADGSWYVASRSLPFQRYFESGFPHGPDQWISMAATNWASMALALSSPRPGRLQ
jgi:ankyrin repeat protein